MNTTFQPLLQRFDRPLRFGLVGVSGIIVNSALLWLLVGQAGLALPLASALATEVAILSNFLLNDRWTFRDASASRSALGRLLRFNGVALGGMAITVGALTLLIVALHLPLLLANLFAVGLATAWNYLANSRWTWGEHTARSAAPAVSSRAWPAADCEPLPAYSITTRGEEVRL